MTARLPTERAKRPKSQAAIVGWPQQFEIYCCRLLDARLLAGSCKLGLQIHWGYFWGYWQLFKSLNLAFMRVSRLYVNDSVPPNNKAPHVGAFLFLAIGAVVSVGQ